MNYESLAKMAGTRRRKLANNTYLVIHENVYGVKFHNTEIMTFYPDGSVKLDSGGYKTVTTKARMNEYLAGFCVRQSRGVWDVSRGGYGGVRLALFEDGMVLRADGTVDLPSGDDPCEHPAVQDEKLARRMRRSVTDYAAGFVKALAKGDVGQPGPGDCMFCAGVFGEDRKLAMGEQPDENHHVMSHVLEKYYVPSLLVNATKMFPISAYAGWWIAAMVEKEPFTMDADLAKRQVASSIRRYCLRATGQVQ